MLEPAAVRAAPPMAPLAPPQPHGMEVPRSNQTGSWDMPIAKVYVHVYVYVYVDAYVYVRICRCICTCMYIYTYMYARISYL